MTVEVIIQAVRLCILLIGYALEEAKKHEAAVLDAKKRRAIFDAALDRATATLRAEVVEEKRQVDAVDDAVDKLLTDEDKTPPGGSFPPHT